MKKPTATYRPKSTQEPTLRVGLPGTLLRGLDRYPIIVVRINSPKDCVIKLVEYKRVDKNGKSSIQEYKYGGISEKSPEFRITKRQQVNTWTIRGNANYAKIRLGEYDAFTHPSNLKW